MKTCIHCGIPKSIDEFYHHPAMKDGRLGKCKSCCKSEATILRNSKLKEIREYDRVRNYLPHRIAARREYLHKHYRTPERKARQVVSNALRTHHLVRLPCAICGALKTEAHHENYFNPLDVVWLCKSHHVEADKRRRGITSV